MHENLKYTLKLDKDIRAFESFHDKNPNNPDDRAEISDWQSIYADNRYGTHYLLYAKFLGENTSDGFAVDKIQLYIQNYKGAVSIGFGEFASIEAMPIQGDDPDMDSRFPNRCKYYLQVALKGQSMKESTISFNPRGLHIKDGDIIMTDPIFVPMNSNLTKIFKPDEMKNSNYLDELFMKRLGSDVYITDEGYDRLSELAALGLVTEDDIIGIRNNIAFVDKYSVSPAANYSVKMATRRYPCIPIYSVCEIKK